MKNSMDLPKLLSLNEINIIFLANKIVFERVELYKSFILTLNDLISSTYLGDEITSDTEKINHFNWCWDKTCNLLNYGKINFTTNTEIYKQFISFYFDVFYLIENKELQIFKIKNLDKMWDFIFNLNTPKSHSELKTFINLYTIFEESHNF